MMSGSCNPVPQCPGLRRPRSFHGRAAQESDLSTRGLSHESKRYKIFKEMTSFFFGFLPEFPIFWTFFFEARSNTGLAEAKPTVWSFGKSTSAY